MGWRSRLINGLEGVGLIIELEEVGLLMSWRERAY